jgi:small basic protein (TIGR04137 family)
MSIHPSLALTEKDRKSRSVLKRTERIRILMEKDLWKKGNKVYGLPKIKSLRIKIKKEKAEKAEATPVEGAALTPADTKEQTTTKGTAAKVQEKK